MTEQLSTHGKTARRIHGSSAAERIVVITPVHATRAQNAAWIWHNFSSQSWPHKVLVVGGDESGQEVDSDAFWSEKQHEHPGEIEYVRGRFPNLGAKRNALLVRALEHAPDYIATMDSDDFYGQYYLSRAIEYLRASGSQLLKFKDFVSLKILGQPVSSEGDGPAVQLERSRATRFTAPSGRIHSTEGTGLWDLKSGGGVLPSGWGFSFVYSRAVVDAGIRYGEGNERSGEEDVLYYRVLQHFGERGVQLLPLSKAWLLAVHIEDGLNSTGTPREFRFPSLYHVHVPRPLTFLTPEALQGMSDHHPSRAVRAWADAVTAVGLSKDPILSAIPDVHTTQHLAERWSDPRNWQPPWKHSSKWFRPPAGDGAGQDVPIDAIQPPEP